MGLTKPAGCFLQLIALLILFAGWTACMAGISADGWSGTGTGFGVLATLIGVALLVIGRQPGVEAIRARQGASRERTTSADRKTKRCPMCAEEILAEARKCKHCGSLLDGNIPDAKKS